MVSGKIIAGPSKWGLLVDGLGKLEKVEFTFEHLGKREVRIQGVHVESGSGDDWVITGHICKSEARMGYLVFRGYYSTKRRQGTFKINPKKE